MKLFSLKSKVKGEAFYNNRRCFSANGFSLLPLALRPRLFLIIMMSIICPATYVLLLTDLDNTAFALASSLSLTVSDSILSLDLKPISADGTFAGSSDLVISANTNNYSGYTLSIAAKTEYDRILSDKSNDNNSSSFSSIETPVINTAFSDSSPNGAIYNNRWGYLPSRHCTTIEIDGAPFVTCDSNDSTYYPAPTTTGDTLDITNSANNSSATSDNNNYTISIGARANSVTKAGTYEGTFVITAIANLIDYSINYNKGNTNDAVLNLPNTQSGVIADPVSDSTNIELVSVAPERTGYVFNGWCSVMPTTDDRVDTCDGIIYNAGATINIDTTASPNITLYAMWRPYIITWDNNHSGVDLPANRETYVSGAIGSLSTPTKPNTQCNGMDCYTGFKEWNTKLDGTGDILTEDTVPTKDTTYYAIWDFNGNTLQATTNDSASCTGTKYDARDGKAYNVTVINSNNTAYCYILDNLAIDKGITLKGGDSDITPNDIYTTFTIPSEGWLSSDQNYYCKAIMAIAADATYGIQYYYNWYAAKANPFQCDNPGSWTSITETNDNLSLGSICPAGWTLPNYNDDIVPNSLKTDGNLAYTGSFSDGRIENIGTFGQWWSSDTQSSDRLESSYYLVLLMGRISRSYNTRYVGQSVRCMRRQEI